MLHFDKTPRPSAHNNFGNHVNSFSGWFALTVAPRTLPLLFLLALLLVSSVVLLPQATNPDRQLVGLWGTEQSFGPLVHGALTIDGRQAQWYAAIAGFNAPVDRNGDRITFSLPDEAGEFRGRFDRASNIINGDWIQPVGVVNNNRYATPVRLIGVSKSVWIGEVLPLDDYVSFYVSIQPGPSRSVTAVMINPEHNFFRRRSYDVILNGSTVAFTNPKRPEDHFEGTYDKASDRPSLPLLLGVEVKSRLNTTVAKQALDGLRLGFALVHQPA